MININNGTEKEEETINPNLQAKDSSINDKLMQYGTYQISYDEFEDRIKKKDEYIAKKLEIKKVYRKFKQKTLFGSKERDELFLITTIKGIVSEKECIYINGNFFGIANNVDNVLTSYFNNPNIVKKIEWLIYGLVQIKNNDPRWFPYITIRHNDPLFIRISSGYGDSWIEGVCKCCEFEGGISGGCFDGLVFQENGDIEISPACFLNGYYKSYYTYIWEKEFRGDAIFENKYLNDYQKTLDYFYNLFKEKHNSLKDDFLGKEILNIGSYDKIELVQIPLKSELDSITYLKNKYILIEDENENKQCFALLARYKFDYNERLNKQKKEYWTETNPFLFDKYKKNERKKIDDEIDNQINYEKCYELAKIIFCVQLLPTMKDYLVDWHDIICDYERFGIIEVGKPYELPGVFKIDKVKSIQIIEDYKFIPKINETFDLSNEPRFGISQKLNLSFSKVDDRDIALEFYDHIQSNEFFEKLNKIKNLFRDGYIEGYYNLLELKELFDNVQGKTTLPENKEIVEHLKYLQLFYEYVIDNIKDTGERESLTGTLKNIINSKSATASTAAKVKGLISDSIDFSIDERLGISLSIEFDFNTTEEQKSFLKIKESLETGEFYSKIDEISKLRRKGYIEGYYNYLELKELFNNVQGVDKLPDNNRVIDAFEFLLNIKHNLIDKANSDDSAMLLTNMIKLLIND